MQVLPLRHLRTLVLRQNAIESLVDLSAFPVLEELELYGNQIQTLGEGLLRSTSLRKLDLSFNGVREIALIDCPNLVELYLVRNKIKVIQNLHLLTNLQTLELGDNRLRRVENLHALGKLKNLYLGKNKIGAIENLEPVGATLEIVSFQSNRITRLTALDSCRSLRELYVSSNGLTEFDYGVLHACAHSLGVLDLASNRLGGVFTIDGFQELEDLWLNHNQIEDISVGEGMTKLTTIYLEGNPVASRDDYKAHMLRIAPHLTQLDALSI